MEINAYKSVSMTAEFLERLCYKIFCSVRKIQMKELSMFYFSIVSQA